MNSLAGQSRILANAILFATIMAIDASNNHTSRLAKRRTMKAEKIIILIVTLLLSFAAVADQRQDRKLWVAIDDGTEDGGLFIDLNGDPIGSSPDVVQVTDLRDFQRTGSRNDAPTNAITIITDQTLNDEIKEEIESLFSNSGHTGQVIFVDRNKISSTEENATN